MIISISNRKRQNYNKRTNERTNERTNKEQLANLEPRIVKDANTYVLSNYFATKMFALKE